MVLIDHQTVVLTLLLMPRTEASIIRQLTIPEWRLLAVIASSSLSELFAEPKAQCQVLGVITCE